MELNGTICLHVNASGGMGYSRDAAINAHWLVGGGAMLIVNDFELAAWCENAGVQCIIRLNEHDHGWGDDNGQNHFQADAYLGEAVRRLIAARAKIRNFTLRKQAWLHWNNEPGNQNLPQLKRQFRLAIESSRALGFILVSLNIAYRNWIASDWEYLKEELLDCAKYGFFIGVHEGYKYPELPDLGTAYPESIGRIHQYMQKHGFKVLVTEFTASLLPDYGPLSWLSEQVWLALLREAIQKIYQPFGIYVFIFTLFPWAHKFDYANNQELLLGFRKINEELPYSEYKPMARKYYMPQFICPPNSKAYRLFGMGDEAMQCVQAADGWVDQKKNELVEEFQITKTAVRRGNDTSSLYTPDGLYRGFVQTQYSKEWNTEVERLAAYGADWCPAEFSEGASFVRRVWLVETWWNGTRKSAYWDITTIRFVKYHDAFEVLDNNGMKVGITVNGVVELNWGGEENYFYGKDHGLVGWKNIRTGKMSWLGTYNGVSIRPKQNNPVSRPRVPMPPSPPEEGEMNNPQPQIPANPGTGVAAKTATSVRIRSFPGTNAPDVRLPGIPLGEAVTIYPDTLTGIITGYPWIFLKDAKGNVGWSAESGSWGKTFSTGTATQPPVTDPNEDIWDEINAPYVTQLNTDLEADLSQNDCGIASGLMIVRNWFRDEGLIVPTVPSVDDVSRRTALVDPKVKGLSFSQVISAFKLLGFTFIYAADFNDVRIIDEITNKKRPVFLLVNYAAFRPQDSFDGSHFLVAKGVNRARTKFKVHDPYNGGPDVVITRTVLVNMLKNVPGNAGENQGMVLAD